MKSPTGSARPTAPDVGDIETDWPETVYGTDVVRPGRTRFPLRRAFSAIAGFSTKNQLIAANGKVATAAIIVNTIGFKMPSPQMTSSCWIGHA
jgi:hypothetical protein